MLVPVCVVSAISEKAFPGVLVNDNYDRDQPYSPDLDIPFLNRYLVRLV